MDIRSRNRASGCCHQSVGRAARRSDVRNPAHERARAIHQSCNAAARIRRARVGEGDVMSMGMTSAPRIVTKEVPSWRLVALMTAAGALAGLLIVTAFQATLPRIQHHQGEVMQIAIQEVLKSPARYDTLYLQNGALVKKLPAGVSQKGIEKVFLGYDANGKRVGFAVSAAENGFQDLVTLMFGYDAASHQLIAMKVIANKET